MNLDPRIQDFLRAFDPKPGERPWYGGASLFSVLRGVQFEEAAWGLAGFPNTIWQLLLHCAYSRNIIRRSLMGEVRRSDFPRQSSKGYWPKLPENIGEKTWKADIDLLSDEHRKLVEVLRSFDPARLDEHASQKHTCSDLLWGIVMHDVYHTGEIQVIKRMYETRVQSTLKNAA